MLLDKWRLIIIFSFGILFPYLDQSQAQGPKDCSTPIKLLGQSTSPRVLNFSELALQSSAPVIRTHYSQAQELIKDLTLDIEIDLLSKSSPFRAKVPRGVVLKTRLVNLGKQEPNGEILRKIFEFYGIEYDESDAVIRKALRETEHNQESTSRMIAYYEGLPNNPQKELIGTYLLMAEDLPAPFRLNLTLDRLFND